MKQDSFDNFHCFLILINARIEKLFLKEVNPLNIKDKKIQFLIMLLTPLTSFYFMQFIYGGMPWDYSLNILLINYICIGILYGIFCGLTNRYTLASWLTHMTCIVFSCINYFVTKFRGLPVVPWDLKALGTAFNVAGTYDFTFTWRMTFSFLFLILLGLFYYYKVKDHKLYTSRNHYRFVTVLLSAVLLLPMIKTNVLAAFGVNIDVWNQPKTYYKSGIMASFIGNSKYMNVAKPTNHSEAYVQSIIDKMAIPSETTEIRPNIVLIMNESWADFEKYGIIETSAPLMENIRATGARFSHAYASVFGAGTSCSEFEALTGHSMAFLPSGSIPYQQYVTSQTHALPSHLKSLGYDTVALHPGEPNSWQRNIAYPKIGFDSYKWADTFDVDLTYEHGYVSDASSFDQIIYEFENKGDDPLFLFNVTIQNHGAYTVKDYPTEVTLTNAPEEFPMAEQYLTLISKTDVEFARLTEYFKNFDEPTIILMFGDHQPTLEKDFTNFALGIDPSDMSMEEYMRKFEVPYVLWSNYDAHDIDLPQTSLNYLGLLLMQQAGLETTEYMDYLNGLQQVIPAISFVGYTDPEGEHYSHLESNELTESIHEFQSVQYHSLFD